MPVTSRSDTLEGWGANVEICDSQVDTARALDCFEGFLAKGVAGIVTTSSAATVDEAADQAIADGIVGSTRAGPRVAATGTGSWSRLP